MNKINLPSASLLWTMFRVHLIHEFLLHYDYHCRLMEKMKVSDEKKKSNKDRDTKAILEAVERYKMLEIPPVLRRLEYALRDGDKYCNPVLGGVKYTGTSGFLTELFYGKEVFTYLHNLLSPGVNIRYDFLYEKNLVKIYSDSTEVMEFRPDGTIRYNESNEGGRFLIFVNAVFGSGEIPTEEAFQKMDITGVLKCADEVSV